MAKNQLILGWLSGFTTLTVSPFSNDLLKLILAGVISLLTQLLTKWIEHRFKRKKQR